MVLTVTIFTSSIVNVKAQSTKTLSEDRRDLFSATTIFSDYKKAQNNPNLSAEDKIRNAIDTYFKLRYEGQKHLSLMDFSYLVAEKKESQFWMAKELEKREVELFMGEYNQLNYLEYKYSLDYTKLQITENGSLAMVQLKEGYEVVFETSAPEVSNLANLEHTITLSKTKNGWVIIFDEYEDELTKLMEKFSKEEIIESIKKNTKKYEVPASYTSQNSVLGLKTNPKTSYHSLTSNNRNSIAYYADTYWQYYNSNYHDFATYGDCTNFVSQAMYEWTPIPMDSSGSLLWYYSNQWNYSLSWIRVNELFDYLDSNYWTGPIGHQIYGLCGLEKADIVQGGWSSSYYAHSVIIVQVYSHPDCWHPGNYLYDAHDNDRYHHPLSAMYMYPYLRLISLDGYYN